MTIWIDAQLSPAIATWIREEFQVDAVAIRELGLRNATDLEIFTAAGKESVTVMTKDADFPQILETKGPPPQIIWITCGNTSNTHLKVILKKTLRNAIKFLDSGENLVEISDNI